MRTNERIQPGPVEPFRPSSVNGDTFRDAIRLRQAELGITLAETAGLMGVTYAVLAGILLNAVKPQPTTLQKAREKLGVDC